MTRIKICGVMEASDALVAAEAGADFIGLVFVAGRRRRLDIQDAAKIISVLKGQGESPPSTVGLFADQPIEEVNHTLHHCGLDIAQLCGQESVEYCGQVDAPVIKVLHVMASWEVEEAVDMLEREMDRLVPLGHRITLDRKVEGLQGGTGEGFDWRIARRLSDAGRSFLLAGGLSPDNVVDAVHAARPWGVDVSSGVEINGQKDPILIRALVQRVRQTDG